MSIKLALYQGQPTNGQIEHAFACIETQLSSASAAGAEMLVLPELFLPGYNQPDLHQSHAQTMEGEWVKRLTHLAVKYQCGLTVGWAEREDTSPEARVFNAATCFDRHGVVLAHHRKIQLFGEMEKSSFDVGSRYTVFEFSGQKAALLICYEVEFPEHCRALAHLGVTLILVPTANPVGYENVSRTLVPARACENALTIVYANYCGEDGGLTFAGLSLIAGADGEPLVQAGNTAALLITQLERQDKGHTPTSTQLADYIEVSEN